MSQKFTLYPDLTIMENIEFAGSLYNMDKAQIARRAKELFNFIGMENLPQGQAKSLSGGIKQMIALAASIVHDPELIFLDEPTAGVSPQTRKAFWDLIEALSKSGKTVFVTTHYMDEAENCHRIVLMERGRILALDTPQGLKEKYFPIKPVELNFMRPDQARIAEEIKKKGLGAAAVFGEGLKVSLKDLEEFKQFAKEEKDIFSFTFTEPTLEDVFLKALSHEEGAK